MPNKDKQNQLNINKIEQRILGSKFGTKMPDNVNKEENLTREQLLTSKMIMGSLGALIWGKSSITKETQLKSLLGNTNTLFDLIKSIQKSSNIITNNGVKVSLTKQALTKLKTNIADPIINAITDDLATSIVGGIYAADEKIRGGELSAIGQLLEASSEFKNNLEKYKEMVKSLDTIFNNDNFKESLQKAIENKLTIEFANPPGDLQNIINLIQSLNTFEGTDAKNITDSFKGLAKLVEVLGGSDFSSNTNDAEKNIKVISNLFTDNDGIELILKKLKEFEDNHKIKSITSLDSIIKLINTFSKKELEINTKNVKRNVKIIAKILSSNSDGIELIIKSLADIANDKKFDDNIHYVMSSLGEFFSAIIKLGELDKKKIKNLERNIKYIKDYITGSLVEIIKEIAKSLKDVNEQFGDSIYALNELFERLFEVADFSFKDMIFLDFKLAYLADIIDRDIVGDKDSGIITVLSKIDGNTLKSVIAKSKKLNELFDVLGIIVNNDSFTLKNVISFLIKLKLISLASDLINESVALIESVITQLNAIKPNKNIKNTLEVIEQLLSLNGNVWGARSVKKTLKIIQGSIGLIRAICDEVDSKINSKKLENVKVVIGTFNDMLLKAAAILLVAGLVMRFINPVKLLLFAVTLGAFMWAITKVFSLMTKSIQENIKVSKDAIELVAISAAILILGGLAMNFINPSKLMLFALTLGVFMVLIATSYLIFNLVKDETFKSAKDFSYLIMVSAGILIIGAIFMLSGLWLQALLFGVLLTGFVTLISFAYSLASANMKASLGAAKGLAILVGISALTLIIGALFVSNPKRIIGVITFALLLAGFIFLVMATIKWAAKDIRMALTTMIAISALIVISALTLLIGAALLTIFPKMMDNVIKFGLILVGFIFAVTLICKMLSSSKKDIIQGVILMAGVTIVIALAAIAIGLIALSAWLISKVGWGNVIGTVVALAVIFGGLLVLCRIIGDPEIAVFIAIGIAVLIGLSIALYLMIGTIAALVAVTKYASTLSRKQVQEAFDNISSAIWGLVKLGPAFMALSVEAPFMAPGIAATIALSIALAGVAKTIQMWADLRIPEYDNNGKIIGYKSMDTADITNASENIKIVLTTLFGAIQQVYNKDKELFNVDWNTLLTGKNPVQRVISSSMQMGKMLANIAYGIKAWAKLRIPEYGSNGKIIGYKTIDNSAFRDAADNIKAVIKTLGEAIIETYKEAPPGMFESKEWLGLGNTPFAKVTKALKTMGPMLSSIAKGIKSWSDLKIPVYEGTKIVRYNQLGSTEFNKAKENIIEVVTCLANAIIDIYNTAPEGMFDDDSWHGFGDTPFARVTKSLKTMGGALNNIADAVKAWAELKIPVYGDKNDLTKITEYKTIDDDVFKKVAQNISYVVCALATSIASLAADPKYGKLFTETEHWWESNTPVVKVLKSIHPMGSALKDIADAIKAWSSMKIPEYNDPKNPTKISGYKELSMTDITTAQQNIATVIKGLIEGVANAYDETAFEEGGFLGFFKHDSPVTKVISAITPIGKSLKNIADALKAWSELKIPIYGNPKSTEPTGYMSIGGDAGITVAMDNIKKVMRAMISAVASVYYGRLVIKGSNVNIAYKDLFDEDNEIIKNITSAMSKMGNMVSDIAKGISAIAALKIPVYNSKGKIIAYHNIENGNFSQISSVISNVLTAIGKAIINVSTDPLLNPEDNPSFATAVEAIKYSTDILSGIAGVIANYASGKFVMYKVEKGKLVPDKLIDINSTDVQQAIQNNIKTVLYTIGDALAVVLGIGAGNNLKYATDKNKGQIEKTKNVIVTLINSIGEIYKAIGDLNNTTKTNKDAINALIAPAEGESKLGDLLNSIIIELNDIAGKFDNAVKTNLKSLSENSADLIKDLDNTYSVLNKTLVVISKLANANFKVKNTDFGYITSAIEKFTTALSAINEKINNSKALTISSTRQLNSLIVHSKKLVELLNNFAEIIKSCKISNDNDYKGLENSILGLSLAVLNVDNKNNLNFKAFTDLIDNYIKVINTISGSAEFDNKVNSLKDGILNLNQIINEVESKNDFAKQVKDLEEYIQTINNIELWKLNQLKGFVDALNQLSSRLGNLDNLTDALANRLTNVLFELVKQLRVADKSIQNAQKLQEYRKKLIEESVDKVRTLMDQPMIVEISQNTDGSNYMTPPSSGGTTTPSNEPQSPPAGAVDGNPVSVETPQNGDTDEPKQPMMLDNPDAEADKNKNKFKFSPTYTQNNADNDTLTKSDFLALMAMNSKGWGET